MVENSTTNVNFSQVNLKKVDFIRNENLEQKEYKIDIVDLIKVLDVKANCFKIEYCRRTIGNEPFFVSVLFDFIVFLDKNGCDFYNGDLERIKNFAELRKAQIVSNLNLPSRASLLIGNIIKELGTPLISAPNVILKTEIAADKTKWDLKYRFKKTN